MMCQEIMKRDLEQAVPGDNLHTAARKMRDRDIGFLPVVDEAGHPVGTLTDRDLAVRAVAEDWKPSNVSVREVMSTDVVTCGRWDDIRIAEELMARHHKSRIMCVDEGGALVGVISLADLAEKEEARQAARVMREVSHRETPPTL